MVRKAWAGFKSSDLIQGIIAVMLGATICYCVVVGKPVPIEVFGSFTLILGFYFRTNNHNQGG